MPIAKELALKILGALAVGGTAVGGGIALKNLNSKKTETDNNATEDPGKGDKTETQENNTPGQDQEGDGATDDKKAETPTEKDADTSKKILEELGLKCGTDNYCSLVTGKKLSVKQEKNTRTLTSLTSSGEEDEDDDEEKWEGKIRFLGTEGEDKKKIAFSIEDGNIRPTWEGSDSSITKLEEFETYEVEEETVASGKKYHFKRKAKRPDEMARLLGLSGSGCTLPTTTKTPTSSCELDLAKLKAINFEGKTKDSDPTIGDGTVTLTITKLEGNDNDKDYSKYPFGYQFVLSGDKEVKVPASPKEIVKKAKVSLGFKIKVTPASGGPKTLSLEKIPQIERMAWKLGFTECKEEGGNKTCKFPSKIHVYKDDKNSIKAGTFSNPPNPTITYEEDVEGYEGGIKFTVSSDISVTPGTIKGTFSKIEKGEYEAKQQTVDSQKFWYLTKKTK